MVQTDSKGSIRQLIKLKKDDLNDIDIMAYSDKIGDVDSSSLDEPAFSTGGAIFEALA